jgi:formate dehydrogenase subunit gamma
VLERFDAAERLVHWCTAGLFLVLVVSGLALFQPAVVGLVGHRRLVEEIHVAAGLALPVPLLVGLLGPWRLGLRADLRRLDRFLPDDWVWLRAIRLPPAERQARRAAVRLGKFNPGQKLHAAWVAGAGLVMLGTGCILWWFGPFPLWVRAGASAVHQWLAVALVLGILGHITFALRDPAALRSMVGGRVSRAWAARHAPRWEAGEEP